MRFAELDQDQDTRGVQAKAHFNQSRLSPVRLAEIWALADEGRDGRLSLPEFVCAAELMERVGRGVELPSKLPPSLWDSALRHSAERREWNVSPEEWKISAEEWQSCRQIFEEKQQGNFLQPNEAGEILDRTQLPHSELSQIWSLSDLDGDGQLRFGEFLCAMHLAERRRRGEALPDHLPEVLMQVATEDLPVNTGSKFEGSFNASWEPVDESLWEVTSEELAQYRALYDDLDLSNGLAAAEAEVLQRSGLASEELAQIWSLADVDYDGQLALCEFACAMALTARRRKGLPVPEELPQSLARLVAGAIEFPTHAPLEELPGVDHNHSKWAIEPEDLERYRDLFLMECPGSFLSFAAAQQVLGRSQLPGGEVEHILRIADDGQLHFGEFAAALHVTALRRQGEELPGALPWPLQELAAGQESGGLDAEEVEVYTNLFEQLRSPNGDLGLKDAQQVFQRSGLSKSELSHVWRLSDLDEDGRLNLQETWMGGKALIKTNALVQVVRVDAEMVLSQQEFVCAMALLQRCREGLPLPSSLPQELQAYAYSQPMQLRSK
eukprot:g24198.t1